MAEDILYRVEDLKQENRDLNRAIVDIAQLVSYSRTEEMINFLIKKLNDYFVPHTLCFFVQPPRSGKLRQYYFTNLNQMVDQLPKECFYIFQSYFENLDIPSNNGFAYPFNDLINSIDSDFPKELLDINTKYVIPLISIGGVFSIIFIGEKSDNTAYSYSELSYMHRIFSVMAVTMQNGLHYEVSITEPKTGLFTYDYFKTRVEECIGNCKRYTRTAAMLLVDIDFFKKFNDTYGHLCGDKVLVALAETIKKSVRETDCVARFGGEEFSILLSECTPESVFDTAERIRKATEQIELYENDQKLQITISVGGCIIDSRKGLTPTFIFKKTDDALYYSKQNGRNRSTIRHIGLLDTASLLLDTV